MASIWRTVFITILLIDITISLMKRQWYLCRLYIKLTRPRIIFVFSNYRVTMSLTANWQRRDECKPSLTVTSQISYTSHMKIMSPKRAYATSTNIGPKYINIRKLEIVWLCENNHSNGHRCERRRQVKRLGNNTKERNWAKYALWKTFRRVEPHCYS